MSEILNLEPKALWKNFAALNSVPRPSKKELGWKPLYDINQAIAMTVEWSKVYAAGEDVVKITEEQIRKTI